MDTNLLDSAAETIDGILADRLRIIQRKRGYRFSLDSLLIAHFANIQNGDELIDLGTGSGIIALILAQRFRCGRVLGIEIQNELVAIAKRNIILNEFAGQIEIRRGDVRCPETFCRPQSFSAAVFNPPYRRIRSGRTNSDPEKAVARHEIEGTVTDFLTAAVYALRPEGRVYVIYPAERMVELIARMRECRMEPKRLRMVHSRLDGGGEFVLVEGVKGGGEGLHVAPPLCIYQDCGVYTPEMTEIFRDLSAFPARGGG